MEYYYYYVLLVSYTYLGHIARRFEPLFTPYSVLQ